MEEAIGSFIQYICDERRYSPQTVKAYQTDLNEFYQFLQTSSEVNITNIHYADVRYYLAYLNEKQLAKTSIARKLSSLRSFFQYALLNHWITENPMDLIQFQVKQARLPNFFYENEIESLMTTVYEQSSSTQERDIALLEVLYATGMRVSELTNLTMAQILWEVQMLRVIGKGNKERLVPLSDSATAALNTYCQNLRQQLNIHHLDYVFLSDKGKQYRPDLVRKRLNDLMEKSQLNLAIHPHKLRHTFATHLIHHGADLRSVQELLGHADLRSTQVYTHITGDQLKQQYLAAHPRARKQSKGE